MRPTVLKLLHQEPVSRNEWQDLFWYVWQFYCFSPGSGNGSCDVLVFSTYCRMTYNIYMYQYSYSTQFSFKVVFFEPQSHTGLSGVQCQRKML